MVDRSPGFFDLDDRLSELSAKGDDLERVKALVDFEMFRSALEAAAPRADRSKGGRPAFDHVLMFKVLILQAMHALSDERTEFLIKDRLSFMRFLDLRIGRQRSRRQYDLDVSGGAEEGRRRRRAVPTVR
jgi:IS5 family transposase